MFRFAIIYLSMTVALHAALGTAFRQGVFRNPQLQQQLERQLFTSRTGMTSPVRPVGKQTPFTLGGSQARFSSSRQPTSLVPTSPVSSGSGSRSWTNFFSRQSNQGTGRPSYSTSGYQQPMSIGLGKAGLGFLGAFGLGAYALKAYWDYQQEQQAAVEDLRHAIFSDLSLQQILQSLTGSDAVETIVSKIQYGVKADDIVAVIKAYPELLDGLVMSANGRHVLTFLTKADPAEHITIVRSFLDSIPLSLTDFQKALLEGATPEKVKALKLYKLLQDEKASEVFNWMIKDTVFASELAQNIATTFRYYDWFNPMIITNVVELVKLYPDLGAQALGQIPRGFFDPSIHRAFFALPGSQEATIHFWNLVRQNPVLEDLFKRKWGITANETMETFVVNLQKQLDEERDTRQRRLLEEERAAAQREQEREELEELKRLARIGKETELRRKQYERQQANRPWWRRWFGL